MSVNTHLNTVPKTQAEVAARGFQIGVRYMCHRNKISVDAALLDIFLLLKENRKATSLGQVERCYTTTGLSPYMLDPVIELFHQLCIPVYRHQLLPTKAVLSSYGIHTVN